MGLNVNLIAISNVGIGRSMKNKINSTGLALVMMANLLSCENGGGLGTFKSSNIAEKKPTNSYSFHQRLNGSQE